MNSEQSIEHLLRWRARLAEAEAPPPPRARELLSRLRPWWEVWPERFRSQVEHLGRMQGGYGYAMVGARHERHGHTIPALLVLRGSEMEVRARILYLSVHGPRLRLRFELIGAPPETPLSLQTTFVSESAGEPLLVAEAVSTTPPEYRLEAELPEELAASWADARVTDRMPLQLLLHPSALDA